MTAAIRRRYDWFRSHGHSACNALDYARAEQWAWENLDTVRAVWEHDHDPEPWDGDGPAPFEMLYLSVQVRTEADADDCPHGHADDCGDGCGWETAASLGGIGMSGDSRRDFDWRREHEAELYAEARAAVAAA